MPSPEKIRARPKSVVSGRKNITGFFNACIEHPGKLDLVMPGLARVPNGEYKNKLKEHLWQRIDPIDDVSLDLYGIHGLLRRI